MDRNSAGFCILIMYCAAPLNSRILTVFAGALKEFSICNMIFANSDGFTLFNIFCETKNDSTKLKKILPYGSKYNIIENIKRL